MKRIAVVLFVFLASSTAYAQLTIKFPSRDGLMVTGDWYPVSSQLPVILLCHGENASRGEYLDIALRLNKFGFNCLAIDQRVGGEINGTPNATAEAAKSKNLQPKLEDAEKDILAALDYLFEKYNRPATVLGSSYSASLAMKIAVDNPKVASVIVFSPGENFSSKTFVADNIKSLTKPIFATSSRAEADGVTDLLKDVNSRIKIQYLPSTAGDHGVQVLWPTSPDNQEYWIALMSYLDKIKEQEQSGQ